VHRQPLQRRGLHAARVREPHARHAGRGVGADHGGANLWADSSVRSSTRARSPACSCARSPAASPKGLADEIPDLEERVDHILTSRCSASASRKSPACWRAAASIARSTPTASTPSPSPSPARRQHLVRAHGAHVGNGTGARTVAQAGRLWTAARGLKPTPTRSFTPTTSRLASPSYLETTCNST
jgi:hypothetical protein